VLILADQNLWIAAGQLKKITGLNMMQSVGQKNLQAAGGIQQLPTTSGTPATVALVQSAPSIAGRQVTLHWTASADPHAYQTYVYRSTTTGFTPGPSNLISVLPTASIAINDSPGVATWYYVLICDNIDGVLSPISNQESAVIV
jgi:hypothetical protein